MLAKSTAVPPVVSARILVIAAVSGRLAMVDVTNGADVQVRFAPIELCLRHFFPTFWIFTEPRVGLAVKAAP